MFLLGVYFRDCAITTWNNLQQVNLKEGFMGNEHVVEKNVSALRTFLVETIIGVLIFLIIACAAVGLSFLVTFLDSNGVDNVIVVGLKFAEYAIFFIDLILFGRFLWKTSLKMWREL